MFINVVVINVYVLWLYYLNHLAAKCVNKINAILSVMCEIHQLFCNLHEPWGKGYTLHLSLAAINIYCPYCHKKLVYNFLALFCNRPLTIGQMQGKFQMVVVRHTGHAIQVLQLYFVTNSWHFWLVYKNYEF